MLVCLVELEQALFEEDLFMGSSLADKVAMSTCFGPEDPHSSLQGMMFVWAWSVCALGMAGAQVGRTPGEERCVVALWCCLSMAELLQSRFWRSFVLVGWREDGWSICPGGGRTCEVLSPGPQ